jgi:peptidoglycan hydrolase-like protein with peptidoglycan-binding domain
MIPTLQQIQEALRQLGYLSADYSSSSLDPTTRDALKRFQMLHDFEVTGELDETTGQAILGALDATEYIVYGQVVDAVGPLTDVLVQVQDQDLGDPPWAELGTQITDHLGRFVMRYSFDQVVLGDKITGERTTTAELVFSLNVPNLPFRNFTVLRMPGEVPITDDDLTLGLPARRVEEVKIVVELEQRRRIDGSSEYERLLADFISVWPDRLPGDLQEDRNREISFVARELGEEYVKIEALATAFKLSRNEFRSDAPPEVFYGLARGQARLADLNALASANELELQEGLFGAIDDNLIPPLDDQLIQSSIELILRTAAQLAISVPSATGQPTFSERITAALPDANEQALLLRTFADNKDNSERFWDQLRAQPEFADSGKIERVQFALQLDALTQSHVPLMQALQLDHGLTSTRDLLNFGNDQLRTVLSRPEIGVPGDVPGDTDTQRIDLYVNSVIGALQLALPTESVANIVRNAPAAQVGDETVQSALNTFFSSATSDVMRADKAQFDIRTTNIDDYVAQHGDTVFAGIAAEDRIRAMPELKKTQRLFRLSTDPDSFKVLLSTNLDSARSIAVIPQSTFLADFSGVLGEQQAMMIHTRATAISTSSIYLYTIINDALRGVHPDALTGGDSNSPQEIQELVARHIPNWQELFGTPELCDCQDCRSVYSAAAYLVDMLHFLGKSGKNGEGFTPLDILIGSASKMGRRPDIALLKLTCENTNTTIPYVDLVNEVLESLAIAYATAAEAQGRIQVDYNGIVAYDTADATTLELQANPQYTNLNAYQTPMDTRARLDRVTYPITLPYDQPIETARVYLDHLGVALSDMVSQFGGSDHAARWAAEYLKVSPVEYEVLTGQKLDGNPAEIGTRLDELYGFTPELLPRLQVGDSGRLVAVLKRKLNANGSALVLEADVNTETFDVAVETEVRSLQQANTLDEDGVVKIGEWRALFDVSPSAAAYMLPNVREFLKRTQITYEELTDVLKTRFINPEQETFSVLERLLIPTADLTAYIQAGFQNPVQSILDALAAADITPDAFATWANDHLSSDLWQASLILEAPPDDGCNLDRTTIRRWDSNDPKLNEGNWGRFNRLIRLWRKLGWSVHDLDCALVALNAHEITPIVIEQLAMIAQVQERLDLTIGQTVVLWAKMDVHSSETLYHKRWLNRATLRHDPIFAPDWKGDVLVGAQLDDHLPALLAGLGVKAADLDAILDDTTRGGELTLDRVSLLMRYVTLSKALDMRVQDSIALKTLSGIDPFSEPTHDWSLLTFVDVAQLVQESGLSLAHVDYLCRGGLDTSAIAPQTEEVTQLLMGLQTALAQIAAEYAATDDPGGALTRSRLGTLYDDPQIVNAFAQMIDGMAFYAVGLDVLPNEIGFPAEFDKRIAYDVEAKLLSCRGALTSTQQATLRELSVDPPYRDAIDALAAKPKKALDDVLANAKTVTLVLPDSELHLLNISSYGADGKPDTAVIAQKFGYVLINLSPILQDAAQRSLVKQMLTETLSLQAAGLVRLIEADKEGHILVHRDGDMTVPLIQDFLDSVDLNRLIKSFVRLHKAALLIGTFELDEAELLPLSGAIINFNELPIEPPIPYLPAPFEAWSRLARYAALKQRLPKTKTRLSAVFNATTAEEAASAFAKAIAYPPLVLDVLIAGFRWTLVDLQDIRKLTQLQTSARLLGRLGISAQQAFVWVERAVKMETADDIKRITKAKYEDAAWLDVARALNDPLRESQKAALIVYLLPRLGVENSDQLYERLLIDVDMDACMMTSRIKQAISSAQLFIQRCLLNLEVEVSPSAIDVGQWEWMQRYRVWEANRKVFLYPENWIEPELRDDKTPFFKELESELLQNEVTDANVEKALLGYLEKLDTVARLQMCGLYVQTDFEPTEKKKEVVHVFGRTSNAPYSYYYRQYVVTVNDVAYWTPWEKVPVDVRGDQIAPVVWNRRLYLFWVLVTTKATPSESTSNPPPKPSPYDEVQLAWSEYANGKWSSKMVSDPADVLIDHTPQTKRLEVSVTNDRLVLVYTYYKSLTASFMGGFGIDGSSVPGHTDAYVDQTAIGGFAFEGCQAPGKVGRGGGTQISWNVRFKEGSWLDQASVQVLGSPAPKEQSTLGRLQNGTRLTQQHLVHPQHDYYFFEDDRRVYFVQLNVTPGGNLRLFDKKGDTFPSLVAEKEPSYTLKLEVAQPYLALTATTASNTANAWISASARMIALDLTAPGTVFQPGGSQNAVGNFAAMNKYAPALLGDLNATRSSSNAVLTFEQFYHPFVCDFMVGLRRTGIPGLLNLANQQLTLGTSFLSRYQPNAAHVAQLHPYENVDFGKRDGSPAYQVTAYSTYNWELFFHVPMLIATRLSQNQRFQDALRWFNFVFHPTDGNGDYWKVLPFRSTPKQQIADLLEAINAGDEAAKKQVAEWRDHPFQPHLIARMRLSAYQKNVVMKFIDNLIAWGDQLFRQDTIETINQAMQLYIFAANLLGPRPQRIPSRGQSTPKTFADLRENLDDFGNAMVEFENKFPFYSGTSFAAAKDATGLLGMSRSFYFCIPQNEKLLSYWDRVADRLFKIRHCMNIEGVARQLPLFEPAIDPALLVRAAARGIDLNSVLNDLNMPAPYYRFSYTLQKALEVCGDLKSLGSELLAALEKRDAEHLALTRQRHELGMLNLVKLVRDQQITEANANLDALFRTRDVSVGRYVHYQELLGAETTETPPVGAQIPTVSARKKVASQEGAHLIDEEAQELSSSHSARDWQVLASTMEILSGLMHYIPSFTTMIGPGVELSFGGRDIGPSLTAIARYQQTLGAKDSYEAGHAGKMSNYARREQEWVLQSNTAAREIMQIDKQVIAAQIRIAVAQQEAANQNQQIKDSEEIGIFLSDKYTNEELYTWMEGRIAQHYFQSYQLAYDLAKKAERTFCFERGLTSTDFIQFGGWDSLRKGLLAGEQLTLQLRQMDRAYHDQNSREYELTKHVSLRTLAPNALWELKTTGECIIDLSETLFDMDYPGHYMRRIKSVSITIPAIVGPFTGVNCTLTLLSNKTRTNPELRGGKYEEDVANEDSRFMTNFASIQSIATSSAQNDSGLFELNFRDERYLPFEGAGAISRWRIRMGKDYNAFFGALSDVVLHIRYTTREGGDVLGGKAKEKLNQLVASAENTPLARLFSLKHEFPVDWNALIHNADGGDLAVELPLDLNRFPFLLVGAGDKKIQVTDIQVLAQTKVDVTPNQPERNIKITLKPIHKRVSISAEETTIKKAIDTLDDIWLICRYRLTNNA